MIGRLQELIKQIKTWLGWHKPAEKQERPDPFLRDGWTRIEDPGPPKPKQPWEQERLSIREWQERRRRERWTGRL